MPAFAPPPLPALAPPPVPALAPAPSPIGPPPPPGLSRASPPSVGIAAGGALQYLSPSALGHELDLVAGSGARWLRADLNWSNVQAGGPDSFDWERYDRVVAGARARGLRPLLTIDYSPEWASGRSDNKYPPRDAADYGRFCGAAAERYSGRGVRHWEVWNEPNIATFWKPTPDVRAYARLLRACAVALRTVDPGATVITGGTAPAPDDATHVAPVTWLEGLYAEGARGHFDAVGHHPYSWPETPYGTSSWNAWFQMDGAARSLRSVMVAHGDAGTPVWITEMGAPTSEVEEQWQADIVRDAWRRWSGYEWAGPLLWFSIRDLGNDPQDRDHWFGLLRRDGSAKPAYAAYREIASGAG